MRRIIKNNRHHRATPTKPPNPLALSYWRIFPLSFFFLYRSLPLSLSPPFCFNFSLLLSFPQCFLSSFPSVLAPSFYTSWDTTWNKRGINYMVLKTWLFPNLQWIISYNHFPHETCHVISPVVMDSSSLSHSFKRIGHLPWWDSSDKLLGSTNRKKYGLGGPINPHQSP